MARDKADGRLTQRDIDRALVAMRTEFEVKQKTIEQDFRAAEKRTAKSRGWRFWLGRYVSGRGKPLWSASELFTRLCLREHRWQGHDHGLDAAGP